MNILVTSAQTELTVKRSRFIAEIFFVETAAQAREQLKAQKTLYADARHVVHAFVIGRQGEVNGCSDDGEPSGTAGRPVLDVMRGAKITNCMITVTRYFGGILLGTGGLVRAYSQAAQTVLGSAAVREWIETTNLSCCFEYKEYQEVVKHAADYDAVIQNTQFDAAVRCDIEIPREKEKSFLFFLRDLTHGRITLPHTEPRPLR